LERIIHRRENRIKKGTPAQVLEQHSQQEMETQARRQRFYCDVASVQLFTQRKRKEIQAWLTATGEDETQTAMAKTVGLPLAIACKLLLQNKIKAEV